MFIELNQGQLLERGMTSEKAASFLAQFNDIIKTSKTREIAWQRVSQQLLPNIHLFNIHFLVYQTIYPHWQTEPDTAPAWLTSEQDLPHSNLYQFMSRLGLQSVKELHQYSITHIKEFWGEITDTLGIVFQKQPEDILKLDETYEHPEWFPGATINIADSCLQAPPDHTALIFQTADSSIHQMSYQQLDELSNQVSNSLIQGHAIGDRIAIAMPMNQYAVAIYLGIIKMGGVVVSIADSFSTDEIHVRLMITKAKAIFTQDTLGWLNKTIPLYEKIKTACDKQATRIPVYVTQRIKEETISLQPIDFYWHEFLSENKIFKSVPVSPMSDCNILFSSGTTGTPKAIIWNHATAIKAASDGFFHQDIKHNDVIAWPTNLGWMMGPWLIFATFINQATLALPYGAPKERQFGEFVQDAHITILGVVPTLVAIWRETNCLQGLNWNDIRLFSSTGECSNPEDMLYLMSIAGYKPIIEYCGGTEIGGAYISSTILENNYPSLFTTPAMGIHLYILSSDGKPADIGEVAIEPPSMGLSTTLLNADHHQIYFKDMPTMNGVTLRRHGDQIKRTSRGMYTLLGRIDDTMKLGGIKTSATEIERCVTGIEHIIEVAAIAIAPPDRGPNQLIIFASSSVPLDKNQVQKAMQMKINRELNPLFKIQEVVFMKELPKTASNKIMRRVLRDQYASAFKN